MEKMGGVAVFGRGLIPDEQIEPPIVVVIGPSRRMRRVERKNAGFFGNVGESSIAVVAQERIGMKTLLHQPSTAQHEYVRSAVIVIVTVTDIESAHLPLQA